MRDLKMSRGYIESSEIRKLELCTIGTILSSKGISLGKDS